MTRIGITGHSSIARATTILIRSEMREILLSYVKDRTPTGITCLARGADQIFAQLVLDLGGRIEVIVPAADYGEISDPVSRDRFQELLSQATLVHEMPFQKSGSESYLAASMEMIRRSDVLIAAWDGGSPDGRGGTADAVGFAHRCGSEVVVVWPAGAVRE
jgi:hypothetical protein